jgi:hypothetical protein
MLVVDLPCSLVELWIRFDRPAAGPDVARRGPPELAMGDALARLLNRPALRAGNTSPDG